MEAYRVEIKNTYVAIGNLVVRIVNFEMMYSEVLLRNRGESSIWGAIATLHTKLNKRMENTAQLYTIIQNDRLL